MHTVRKPKASEKKSIWKRPPPIRLSHIFANIIGISNEAEPDHTAP